MFELKLRTAADTQKSLAFALSWLSSMQNVIDGLEWEVHEESRNGGAWELFTITVWTNTATDRNMIRKNLVTTSNRLEEDIW